MPAALLVVDMLNDYEHEDARPLAESARVAVPQIRALIDAARAGGSPVVYVNDTHGDWTAGRAELTEMALAGREPDLVEPIAPDADTPLLLKARHSAFYQTHLEYLLREVEVNRVVLTGQVTEQCILYSALDAYLRHFDVVVPTDAVAHIDDGLAEAALRMMERNMHAEVGTAADLRRHLARG